MRQPVDPFFKKKRPFPPNSGASNYSSNNYPKMTMPVRISSIQATQDTFDPARVEKVSQLESVEPIMLWKDSRGYRVIDGHHRVIAAQQRGDKTINAEIYYP